MARNATSAGDSEILTFIMALQCFVAFILAKQWISGSLPGIGLVGGVFCYVACLGKACARASDYLDKKRNQAALKSVKKERESKLKNPYADRPMNVY